MHDTEGPDFETVSGERRYQDGTPPETTVPAGHLNAIQGELRNVVLQSGLTLAADAAADLAAGRHQVADAIAERDTDGSNKILSCQWQDTNDGSPNDVSANFDVQYIRSSLRKILIIKIPNSGMTLTGNRFIYLRQADASALPSDWNPEGSHYDFCRVNIGAGDPEAALIDVVGGNIVLQRVNATPTFPAGDFTIWGQTLVFMAEDPMD